MSQLISQKVVRELRQSAITFSALGDETRLDLLIKLGRGQPLSITRLSQGMPQTRQAITRHLEVLSDAGLIRSQRQGRENLFEIQTSQLTQAIASLQAISAQWDNALDRLRQHVESPDT